MAKSLRKRFNGHSQEVIQDIENFGPLYAMEKYQVKTIIAISDFYKEQTGKEIDALVRKPSLSSDGNVGDQIVTSMANYILKTDAYIKHLKARIENLEWQLKKQDNESIHKVGELLNMVNRI